MTLSMLLACIASCFSELGLRGFFLKDSMSSFLRVSWYFNCKNCKITASTI